MSAVSDCQLTMKDCVVLEVILDRSRGRHDPTIPIIRQKLAGAKVFFRDEIDAPVVTLNSRVVFRVNDGSPRTRVVVQRDEGLFPGVILPITSLRGIALLGMQEGQSIAVRQPCGLEETIRVERVEYQPEAAMRWLAGTLYVPTGVAASSVCLNTGGCAARSCRGPMAMIQGQQQPKWVVQRRLRSLRDVCQQPSPFYSDDGQGYGCLAKAHANAQSAIRARRICCA